jgi:AcrR family transcriptional regulator
MPRTPPRTPRRDAGRPRGEPIAEAVLTRTLEELAAHGPEHLSVERIAKAAELNKTSVYRRWPTREALIAAALERVAAELTLHLVDTGSLRGDLLAMGTSVATFIESPAGRALARAALSEPSAPEIAAVARRRLEEDAAGAVGAMVLRAVERGEWRTDLRPDAVLGMLVGSLIHRVLFERGAVDPDWIATVVEVLSVGVSPTARNAP